MANVQTPPKVKKRKRYGTCIKVDISKVLELGPQVRFMFLMSHLT